MPLRTPVAAFLLALLAPAHLQPARAAILSHNGTLGFECNPQGEVDVFLDSSVVCGDFDDVVVTKEFNEVAAHEMELSYTSLFTLDLDDWAFNKTAELWTDYHISLVGNRDFTFDFTVDSVFSDTTGSIEIDHVPCDTLPGTCSGSASDLGGGQYGLEIWIFFDEPLGFNEDVRISGSFPVGTVPEAGMTFLVDLVQFPTVPS